MNYQQLIVNTAALLYWVSVCQAVVVAGKNDVVLGRLIAVGFRVVPGSVVAVAAPG